MGDSCNTDSGAHKHHNQDEGDKSSPCCDTKGKVDKLLWGSLTIVALAIFIHLSGLQIRYVSAFSPPSPNISV